LPRPPRRRIESIIFIVIVVVVIVVIFVIVIVVVVIVGIDAFYKCFTWPSAYSASAVARAFIARYGSHFVTEETPEVM
jgi:hypothetical protein